MGETVVGTGAHEHAEANAHAAVLPKPVTALAEWSAPREARVAFNRPEARTSDLVAALAYPFHSDPLVALRTSMQSFFGRDHIFFAPSGQCAIAQLVAMLPQKEVVMPAYMCYQVRHAIAAVGKKIIYVDLAKNGVNSMAAQFEEAARPGRILLAAHLYGVPTDIGAICDLAKRRDCVAIEDAVPAFGGRHQGRLLGTVADFGVFSFHHSKRMSAFSGAMIVCNNNQVLSPSTLDTFRLLKTKREFPLADLVLGFAQNFGTAPWIYRNLTLPLLPLREMLPALARKFQRRRGPAAERTDQATQFSLPHNRFFSREVHAYQGEILLRMMNRINAIRGHISSLVRIYNERFRDTPIESLVPDNCDTGAFMRFPVVFAGKDRDQVMRRAEQSGVQLKSGWRGTLSKESEASQFPNATLLARRLTVLPLYTGLTLESADALARTLVKIAQQPQAP